MVSVSHINSSNQSVGVETQTYSSPLWGRKKEGADNIQALTTTLSYGRGKKAAFTLAEVFHPAELARKIAFTLAEVLHPAGSYHKIAFNLAEVLITLGIIGIVAALTLPQLIANYKKQQTISQLKKSYATLEQGFLNASRDHDLLSLGDNWTNFDEVMETMSQYFKTVKKYTVADSTIGPGSRDSFCTNTRDLTGFPKQHPGIGYRWVNQDTITHGMTTPITGKPSFILTDGSCVGFINWYNHHLVVIDINGNPKGPNRSGYDLFFFQINTEGQFKPYYGQFVDNPSKTIINRNCDKNGYQSGASCAAKIIQDGWEINYW